MAEHPKFESMNAAIEAMRYWPERLPFPLRDEQAPESIVEACKEATVSAALAQKKAQDGWESRLSGRDAAVLLAYEDNAAKLESRLGMSSLHLWAMAFKEMKSSWDVAQVAPMSKEEMKKSFQALLNSGASMEAAFWARSDLPIALANNGLLDEMTLLCEAGFPLARPFAMAGYSGNLNISANLYSFATVCSKIERREGSGVSKEKTAEAMRLALRCALAQGMTLEERDTLGFTPLGLMVAQGAEGLGGILMHELLALGADPTRVGRHPLAACANIQGLAEAALTKYQSRELDAQTLGAWRQAQSSQAQPPSLAKGSDPGAGALRI